MWKSHDFIVEAPRDVAPVENKHLALAGEPPALVALCFSAWDWDSPQPTTSIQAQAQAFGPSPKCPRRAHPSSVPEVMFGFSGVPSDLAIALTSRLRGAVPSVGLLSVLHCEHPWLWPCSALVPSDMGTLLPQLGDAKKHCPLRDAMWGGSSQGRLCLACS